MTFVIEKDVRLTLNISLSIDIPCSYGKEQQDKNVIYNDRMLNPEFDIHRNSMEKLRNHRSWIDLKLYDFEYYVHYLINVIAKQKLISHQLSHI